MTTGLPAPPTRDALRAHLTAGRIAGAVATPRESNLANIGKMLDGHPEYTFGLSPRPGWSPDEVLAVLAERVGVHPDPSYTHGQDTIDPDRTLDRLDVAADRVAKAVANRARVLLATGHPTGLLALHLEVAAAFAAAGCEVLRVGDGHAVRGHAWSGRLRYLNGVAMVTNGADWTHTHDAAPMRAVLAAADEPPDLVVADHGFAGAAAEVGIDTVGFADCNDPALFVGEAEGKPVVAVPLDDNVAPYLYAPVTAYLLRHVT